MNATKYADAVRESEALRSRCYKLQNDNDALLDAAKVIMWKLSHNFSASGNGGDCKPGTIDRTDAVIAALVRAIAQAEGTNDGCLTREG